MFANLAQVCRNMPTSLVGFSTNANLAKLEEDIQISVFLLTNFLFSNF